MKRISVLIVTYKQQDVIGRTIESALKQKDDGLYEIVICDDHSPDKNWDVIQSYQNNYPNIIRAYKNETNLGIYGNSNKLVTLRGNADLFCWLEGDDEICEGFFHSMQELCDKVKPDIETPIALMSNYVVKAPDGKRTICDKNRIILNNKNFFGLYIRGLVSWRGSMFTAGVMNKFVPAVLDQGLGLAESTFDCQFFRYLRRAHYIPIEGTVYYSGIGVSVDLIDKGTAYQTSEALRSREFFLKNYVDSFQDKAYLKSEIIKFSMHGAASLSKMIRSIIFFLCGMLYNYPLNKEMIRQHISPMYHAVFKK